MCVNCNIMKTLISTEQYFMQTIYRPTHDMSCMYVLYNYK